MTSQNITLHIQELLGLLAPTVCKVIDFSNQHSQGENSHFSITLVSDSFSNTKAIERHRMVNRLLQPLLHNPVHAWTLNLYSPDEWTNQQDREIPTCRGAKQ